MANDPFMDRIWPTAYAPDARDKAIFGEHYAPPDRFDHGAWHIVAHIPKTGDDGQSVEIDECRWPARFFRLRALADVDGIGRPKAAFALATGSGDAMGRLMLALGCVIAQGMVGLARDEEVTT